MEFSGSNHLILKEDDIVGILETDDVKDLKPLNDRVLIKVCYHSVSLNLLHSNYQILISRLLFFFIIIFKT